MATDSNIANANHEANVALADLSKLKIDRSKPGSSGESPKRRPRWIKLGIIAAVAIVALIVLFSFFGGRQSVETGTVAKAYPSQNYTLLNATGYVVAQRKAALSSKATGRLEWLGVLEGSVVKKDELIARLENRDVAANLMQADANVKVAQANLEQGQAELRDAESAFRRAEELRRQNFISAASLDAARARYDKARASISGQKAAIAVAQGNRQAAQVAYDQTLITAPFDGVILTKNANVGDNITPFSAAADTKGAVVTIADMETLEVEADVSEANLSKIAVDQPAEIQLDALPDIRMAGVVSRIVPTVDRTKATIMVKVRFVERDPRVLPDMSAKVAFLSQAVPENERAAVTAVPPSSVIERGGKKVVFAVRDGKAKQIEVQTGRKIGELIEVSGIEAGEKIVLTPTGKIKDGTSVSLAKK